MTLTLAQLQHIMPASMRASLFLEPLNAAMQEFGIDTMLRQAMFLANVGAESGQLGVLVENLNYSADRIRIIGNRSKPGSRWRSLVPRADELAGSPERLGNALYCDRLGNGNEASGDGFRYRGRGLLQTSFHDNYVALMMAIHVDCVEHPELLEAPAIACRAAGFYWASNGLNRQADAGDFDGACDLISIGHKTKEIGDAIEYAKRLAFFNNAKEALR